MLQIVHQVATLRHGRLDHVHDVAPWPDAAGGQTSVAVSLEAPTWCGASTGLRPVKTQLSRGSTPLTDAARYVVVIWPEHVAGWTERHRPDVLALRYEELVADLPGGIGQVADLMGVDLDPDAWRAA